ncbi:MAG: universal stress protein [Nitrospirae bacterium]|nr:universal stress protein [Nitrospirota bacterium]
MYRKILAAVNEHLNSEVAARYALTLASHLDAKLYICFVARKDMSQQARRAAEDAMKKLFHDAMEKNIRAESIAEIGDPVAEIGKIVRHEGISLVFASTRREDTERRFFTGTIARNLSLKLPCSVALVRVVHSGRVHPGKILVPLKERIDHVTERAYFTAALARTFKSKVYVFHAPKKVTRFFHGEIHLTPEDWEQRMPQDISRFTEQLEQQEIEHENRLLPGGTGKNITIEAFAKRHDLIIMGASERRLFSSLLRGNPVEYVLRETPCDLIILTPRHED